AQTKLEQTLERAELSGLGGEAAAPAGELATDRGELLVAGQRRRDRGRIPQPSGVDRKPTAQALTIALGGRVELDACTTKLELRLSTQGIERGRGRLGAQLELRVAVKLVRVEPQRRAEPRRELAAVEPDHAREPQRAQALADQHG